MPKIKSYVTCLPASIKECTWIENTPKNVKILEEKNKKIKENRA